MNGGTDETALTAQQRRQLAAIQSLARIPLADLRDQRPPNLQALYAELQDGQALIPGLKMGLGALTVQHWDPAYAAKGWTLYGADLTLDMGHPFGSMFYRDDTDGLVLRIAPPGRLAQRRRPGIARRSHGTGCSSSPTPATTSGITCRAEELRSWTRRRPYEAAR